MDTWGEFSSRHLDNTHFELDIPSIRTDLECHRVTMNFEYMDCDDRLVNERIFKEGQLATTGCVAVAPKTRGDWNMCDGCRHRDEDGSFSDGDCDRLVVDLPSPLRAKECCRRGHTNSELTTELRTSVKAISLSLGYKDHNVTTGSTNGLHQDRQDATPPGTVVKHDHPVIDIDTRTAFRNAEHGFPFGPLSTSHNDYVTCSLAEPKTPTDPWTSSRQPSEFTGKTISETSCTHFRTTSMPGTSYRGIWSKPSVTGESRLQLSQFGKSVPKTLLPEFAAAPRVPDKVFTQFKDKLGPRVSIGQSSEFGPYLPEESPKLSPRASNGQSSEFMSSLPEESAKSTPTGPVNSEKPSPPFKETPFPGGSVGPMSELETTAFTRPPPSRQSKRNYFLKTHPTRKIPCSKLAPGTGLSRRAKSLQRLPVEEANEKRRRINEQERVRQRDIAEAFDALRRLEMPLNPDVTNKDDSKMYLLKTAVAYIAALMKMIEDFDMGLLGPAIGTKARSSKVEISADSTRRQACKPSQTCKPSQDCKPNQGCKPSQDCKPTQDAEPIQDSKPTQLLPNTSSPKRVPVLSNTSLPVSDSSGQRLRTGHIQIQHQSTHPDVLIPYVVPHGVVHPNSTIPMVAPVHHIDPRAFLNCDPMFNVYSSMSPQVGFLSPIPNPGFMHPAAVPFYSPAYYPLMATPQSMFYSQDNLLTPPCTATPGVHRPAPVPDSPRYPRVLDLTSKEPTPGADSSAANRTFHGRVQTLHSTPQQNRPSPSQLLEASFPNSTPIRPVSSVTNPATTPNASEDVSSSSKNTTGGSSGYLSLTSPLPQRDSRCFSPDRLSQTMDEMYSACFPKHSPKQRLTFEDS